MRRLLLLFVILLMTAGKAFAQGSIAFDDYFEDRTLRLDYVFAGNNREQHIFFEQAYATPRWAGRRSRLADMPLRFTATTCTISPSRATA